MKRLLTYLKPHKWVMTAATILVLFIIAVELFRPIIIGDAIDDYINGYYTPYTVTTEDAPRAVPYRGLWLTKDAAAADSDGTPGSDLPSDGSAPYFQMFLWQDHYYMAEHLTPEECALLEDADPDVLSQYAKDGAVPLSREDLKQLRHYDFTGILTAAALYLALMLFGFLLNSTNTWMLQKMGQKIVYRMREETFSHIHSLSLSFFNTTPVGKLVTRVSNDTEAVHELV